MKEFRDGILLPERATPSAPPVGLVAVYAKADGKLYIQDDAGAETDLTATGGGGGTWTTIIKTADESKNLSAVVADDSQLVVALSAGVNYTIRLRAHWITNATVDLKYRLVYTGTTTRVRRMVRRTATTDTAVTYEVKTAMDAADVVLGTTGTLLWLEEDVLIQALTAGSLKLQWGQVASGVGPTTLLEGSYLEHAVT